jgi:hypothetical protein
MGMIFSGIFVLVSLPIMAMARGILLSEDSFLAFASYQMMICLPIITFSDRSGYASFEHYSPKVPCVFPSFD